MNSFVDRYEFIRPIGRGGFGEVWLAKRRTDQQFVAVKIIPQSKVYSLHTVRFTEIK